MFYMALFEIVVSFVPVIMLLTVFLTIVSICLNRAERNWNVGSILLSTDVKINAIFWAICGTALVSPFIMGAYTFIFKPYLLG